MAQLEFQPEMIGRQNELKVLHEHLGKASQGRGTTLFISGEAGIGKTRLLEEIKNLAGSRGFQILSGNSLYESLTPYMPFLEALRSGGMESLFAEEAPRVEAVYLVTNTGLLVKEVLREETELDSDLFASMLTTVGDFVKDSLSMLSGEEREGVLNSLGYENHRILIESGKDTNLAVILTGRENEFLINDMRDILVKVQKKHGEVLRQWDGDEEGVREIEDTLRPLVASGKYDGVYFGLQDPEARRNLLFENVSLGLTRQAETAPTLLCIEDLHWADPSSLALMHYTARNTRKCSLLLVGTFRPEDVVAKEGKTHPLVETMQMMSREDLCERIELERLPQESTSDFLSAMLGETDFSDKFRNRIHEEAEGNPLFLIELIKLLAEENLIRSHEGVWTSEDPETMHIPSKIFDLITRRLNRVGGELKEILDYASVIGEGFTSNILASATGLDRVALLKHLRALEQTHSLVHTRNGEFRFDHSKIKEVLYEQIPQELRREYHSIIGGSIEEQHKDDPEEVIEDLAFHFNRCRDKDKALYYLMRAAERAKKEFSNEEATRFYTDALEYESDKEKKAEILESVGEIHLLTGENGKAVECLRTAMELAHDTKRKARVGAYLGSALKRSGDHDGSTEVCNRALLLVEGEESEEEAMVLNVLGRGRMSRADYDGALECFERSKGIGRKIGDRKSLAGSLNNIGIVSFHNGRYDKALECWTEALELAKKIEDWDLVSCGLGNLGVVYATKGELAKAIELWSEAIKVSERVGALPSVASWLGNIGNVYCEMGEYDKALEHQEMSLEISERAGSQAEIALAHTQVGETLNRMGEYHQALKHYEKSLKIHETIDDPGYLAYALIGIAEIYFKMGDLDKSMAFCNKGSELAVKIGHKENIAASSRLCGMIHREKERWEESANNFEESIRIFEEIGHETKLAETLYEFGLLWRERGDSERAGEHLRQALEKYEKLELNDRVDEIKEELGRLEDGTDRS
jgi:tetratricopeptide (TPR) repeat protein/predicted regulator of Ras-like GTPase activity (Roadblock/LC7/MglB family)